MFAAQFVTLLACSVTLAWALAVVVRTVRGVRKRRLLLGCGAAGVGADAPDGAGVSVVCSGICDPKQVENLLEVEYARYEVVVVTDARLGFAEFDALLSRYRMIRVNYAPCGDLPVEGVRGLYRSRQRAYRRLVVIDRAQSGPCADFDAAAEVAAYDWLLPVRKGCRLVPGAVERLVAELALAGRGELELLRTGVGEPALLVCRDAVLREGGFGRRTGRSVPRNRRRMLYEPLLYRPATRRGAGERAVFAAGVALVAATVAAAWMQWWVAAALAGTAAAVWSALRLTAALAGERTGLPLDGMAALRRGVRRYSV